MIDAYEQKHGPVDDRSIFDGEIVVPPHLRNMSLTSLRANRLHGSLFGSLSRSRTFLNFSQNARHTYHGSVPDLSRNHSTFSRNNNSNNNVDGYDYDDNDDDRSMSSKPTITKITMNSSTTVAFKDASSSLISNGIFSQYSSDRHDRHSSDSIDESNSLTNTKSDDGYKSNSIRSLNDIQLCELTKDRTMFCQSLGRPTRVSKPNIYTTKPSDFKNTRSQSMDAHNVEGYMTLIKTNPQKIHTSQSAYLSSTNRAISPLCNVTSMHIFGENDSSVQMTTSTSTFQCKQPPQSSNHFKQSVDFPNQLSLGTITKFKLPRVTLNHSTITNPQQ